MNKNKILIATGGTGGHLFPAIHLAKQLKDKNMQIIFAGNQKKRFPGKNITFYSISSSTITKKNILRSVFKILYGVFQSAVLIKKFKPSLVVSFGSFYCFPILLVSKVLKIPYVVYEPNAVCGVVNRLFSKGASAFCVQFKKIEKHNSKNLIATSFLPWKTIKTISKSEARSELSLEKDLFTLLIFGGSQGALFLNDFFLKVIKKVKENDIQIIHITGDDKYTDFAKQTYKKLNIVSYVSSFVEDIPFCCLASDLAICRSGAAAIGDLIQTYTPSILIPYPYATGNHQYKNAKIMQDEIRGSYLFSQNKLTEQMLIQAINDLRHNKCLKLHTMRNKIKNFYKKESLNRSTFAEIIEELCLRKNTMS